MQNPIKNQINIAYNYVEYRTLIDRLLAENKATGDNHSDSYLNYTRLNVQRMNRLEKTAELLPDVKKVLEDLETPLLWLVLTEGWCGDAAQNLPIIQQMAEQAPKITLQLILRDEHLEIMDQYLTNGGRSIPKLICFHEESQEELWTWGPRPQPAQQIFLDYKANPVGTKEDMNIRIQKWYAKDKGSTIQKEIVELIH